MEVSPTISSQYLSTSRTSSGSFPPSSAVPDDLVSLDIMVLMRFNGTETFIRAPDGDGPVTHTVSFLIVRTNYTFTLFSVFENVRSSGVNIRAATDYVLSVNLRLRRRSTMSESEVEDALVELFRKYNLPPQFSIKIVSSKP
ncbi:hypothetical protein ILYODFUR_031199 [Ilyodon furcidens]|uniref:Uncharacterized protein n=1 Tax=Ilyodon furcidens TaxID=33524 RepID=A0ABV0SS12_9TELE